MLKYGEEEIKWNHVKCSIKTREDRKGMFFTSYFISCHLSGFSVPLLSFPSFSLSPFEEQVQLFCYLSLGYTWVFWVSLSLPQSLSKYFSKQR